MSKVWKENNLPEERNLERKQSRVETQKPSTKLDQDQDTFTEFERKLTNFGVRCVIEWLVLEDDLRWIDSSKRTTKQKRCRQTI
jgi:hypothetical protein